MKLRIIAGFIFILGIGIGFFVYNSQVSAGSRFPFRLGLDLSGGTLLTYRADVSEVAEEDVDDAMRSLRDVIERRVNVFGVSEPLVQTEVANVAGQAEQRLIVELPGVTDVTEAVNALGETPLLEFKLLNSNLSGFDTSDATATVAVSDLYISTGLTGRFLESARLEFGQGGSQGLTSEPVVTLQFNGEGAQLFEEITTEHVGEILAVFLDGEPITQPVIQGAIPGGQAVITGDFMPEEARELARNLNFGALPVPIELIGSQSIGPALGQQILEGGLMAGVWGLGLVALFMLAWYRLPGLVSVVSLAIYLAVMLALFKLIPVTLTAAGIAGFILSLGMAVDANVLIFERLREELLRARKHAADQRGLNADGRGTMQEAIEIAFKRAWPSIRDGNVTSIFTAIILFYTTTSLVRGFALVFGLGVLVSMITAVSVTRTFLFAAAPEKSGALFGSGIK